MNTSSMTARAALLCLFGLSAFGAVSPVDVGSHSQLFVDQVLVNAADGVAFTLHPARPHPKNPILKADQPWEGWRVEIYGNVIYDEQEKRFKMWYYAEEHDEFPRHGVYYATSQDGVHWDKPLLGEVKSSKYARHNVIADGILLPSVIKDVNDPDPERRYKMIGHSQDAQDYGYHTWTSPDGIHWTRFSESHIARGADVITGYYDEQRGCYVAFPKINHPVRGFDRRVFWLTTSPDFRSWSEPQLVFVPDLRDDAGSLARIEEVRPILDVPDEPALIRTEFYGIGAYPAESCTLAFIWVFTINNEARYGNQEGPGELQLAVSRDLLHWERPFRQPCVPRGKPGEWDCGFFGTQSRALRVGDEIWLYYGGSNYTHGTPCLYREEGTGRGTQYTGSLGLAIWDLDRFVSVDAPAESGSLTTVPLTFAGERLELNAHVSGSLTVALCDAAGAPYPGFEASDEVTGDQLRHSVTWDGRSDVSTLRGKPVVIRFMMRDAQLFAFAFRD
ncbi:MAG: hypothetical protein ACOX5J_02590 [Candidatus Hydrogenedentales bacterium]|jgi:hypothetical protein